jgi:hypothetical protein
MPVYIFASETHTAVSALMSDHTGDNLPQDYAPWRPVNNGRALPAGPQAHSIVEAIQRDGFFLISREDQAGDVSRDGPGKAILSGSIKGGRDACGQQASLQPQSRDTATALVKPSRSRDHRNGSTIADKKEV